MAPLALPLAKLVTLLIKTVAKPVSKRIKRDFSQYKPTRRLLVGIGQTNHSITTRLSIWSEGYTVRHIKPLEDEKALSNGADFVGESFILMVSMGTVIWEYNRSTKSNKAKEIKRRAQAKAERDALQANFVALDERLRAVETVVKHNSRSITNITGIRYVEPKQTIMVPISDEDDHLVEDDKRLQTLQERLKKVEQSTGRTTTSGSTDVDEQDTNNIIQQSQQPDDDQAVLSPSDEKDDSSPWWKFW